MGFLAKLSLRLQLTLLTLIFITIALVLGLQAIIDGRQSQHESDNMYRAAVLPLANISKVMDNVHTMRANIYSMTMLSPQIRANEVKQLKELQTTAAAGWNEYYASLEISAAPGEKEIAEQIVTILPAFRQALDNLMTITADTSDTQFDQQAMTLINETNRMLPLLRDLRVKLTELAEISYQIQNKNAEKTLLFNGILLITTLVAGPILALVFIRVIKNGMNEVVASAQAISEKRLNRRIPDATDNNEIGQLFSAFQSMQNSLQNVIGNMNRSSHELADTSKQLNQVTQSILHSSAEQNDAASSAALAVEQLTQSISQVSERAHGTREAAENARQESQTSSEVIRHTTTQVQAIAGTMQTSATLAQDLGERSQEINVIVNTIRDIADQTNLLALNAAIEAARAGEQGRGFAVVADEVRKLAERTASSTEEIGRVIDNIRNGIETMVDTMQVSQTQVEEGVSMANDAQNAIERITQSSQHVLDLVAGIVSALDEQTKASTQVANNVSHIVAKAEENNLAVQKVSDSSQRLDQLAQGLSREVSEFQL